MPFSFNRLGLRVPAILVSPWLEPAVDSTVYSHATIPGTLIENLQLPGGFLTKRDNAAAKLTKYLVDDGKRKLRKDTPDLAVPVQPQDLDVMQREVLAGSVHLDPHKAFRNELRTHDIQSAEHARLFIRTQVSKHLEADEIKSLGTRTVRVNHATARAPSGYVRRLSIPDHFSPHLRNKRRLITESPSHLVRARVPFDLNACERPREWTWESPGKLGIGLPFPPGRPYPVKAQDWQPTARIRENPT